MHASDYNKNLPALSNVPFASPPPPPRKPAPEAAPQPVHTVRGEGWGARGEGAEDHSASGGQLLG